jgi:hypothetical protein
MGIARYVGMIFHLLISLNHFVDGKEWHESVDVTFVFSLISRIPTAEASNYFQEVSSNNADCDYMCNDCLLPYHHSLCYHYECIISEFLSCYGTSLAS